MPLASFAERSPPAHHPRASASAGVTTVGYGDHPTDVPFLAACDSGVLVEELDEYPESITYKQPSKFDASTLI